MKATKDNATYLEKIVTQDDGDSDFEKVTDTTVNHIPNEIFLLDTTTNTQLESEDELIENEEVLLIDADNNITETQLGSVTTGIIDTTQTLDIFNDNSCVACYPFDNETANDLSGNYDGTINNVSFDNGKFGKAVKRSTSDRENHIIFSESGIDCISNSDIFTLSFWAKIPSLSDYSYNNNSSFMIFGAGTGYDQGNCGNRSRNIGFSYFDGNFSDIQYFEQPDDGTPCGGGNQRQLSFGIKPDSIFHHFVVIKNGANVKLYLDNVLVNEASNTFTNKTGMKYVTALSKGFAIHSNSLSSPGLIDQVRIFNRTLTNDEVDALYNEQITKYIADISSANLSEAPAKAFKKQTPSVRIAIEATEADITDTSFNDLTPETTTYDGSKFTTVYSDLAKEGRYIQRKIVAPNKGIQVIEPFISNLWKKG